LAVVAAVASASAAALAVTAASYTVFSTVGAASSLEPPQAASDRAISDTPPALAAFLAFFDSHAFTSLLVAFSAPEGGISAFYCNWLMPQTEQ
jgi:hypothetical protein